MIRLGSIIKMLITNDSQASLISLIYLINLGLRWR